jgi:hypothetical protein
MRIGIFIPGEGLRLTSGWKKYRVRNRSNRNMFKMPKVRNQKSEVRSQGSEIGSLRSGVGFSLFDEEGFWVV